MKNAASKQNSIINDITKETNDKNYKNECVRPTATESGCGVAGTNANSAAPELVSNISHEERTRQQIQQQQLKQRQQQILQFQQQIQQQHNLHLQHNPTTISQQQPYTVQQQQHLQQQTQQRRCIVPHAYALYDFDSNEPNDLKFKKGDLILLKRKIDTNWYVGQLKGTEGNFPINYVQVEIFL